MKGGWGKSKVHQVVTHVESLKIGLRPQTSHGDVRNQNPRCAFGKVKLSFSIGCHSQARASTPGCANTIRKREETPMQWLMRDYISDSLSELSESELLSESDVPPDSLSEMEASVSSSEVST